MLRKQYAAKDNRLLGDDEMEVLQNSLESTLQGFFPLPYGLPDQTDAINILRVEVTKLKLGVGEEPTKAKTNISVALHNSNAGAVNIQGVVGEIHSDIRSIERTGNRELSEGLSRLEQTIQESKELDEARRAAVLELMSELASIVVKPPEEQKLNVVRSLFNSMAAILSMASDVAQVWSAVAPLIISTFNLSQ